MDEHLLFLLAALVPPVIYSWWVRSVRTAPAIIRSAGFGVRSVCAELVDKGQRARQGQERAQARGHTSEGTRVRAGSRARRYSQKGPKW